MWHIDLDSLMQMNYKSALMQHMIIDFNQNVLMQDLIIVFSQSFDLDQIMLTLTVNLTNHHENHVCKITLHLYTLIIRSPN